MRQTIQGAVDLVASLYSDRPVHIVHAEALSRVASETVATFPGDVLYAVKCNDHPDILRGLYGGGIRHFDTASLTEIEVVYDLFEDAVCHFMHPVKAEKAIARSYQDFGVQSYALDHESELDKIIRMVGPDPHVTLYVRIDVPRNAATMDLGGKFGLSVEQSGFLLRKVAKEGYRTGLTFHVGSHCLAPEAFAKAIAMAGEARQQAGVPLDALDVGGGFPGAYSGTEPTFAEFADIIEMAVAKLGPIGECRLKCEPGRGLVAEGQSILTRVELRRDDALFLNDGVFGGLSELKYLGPVFPMRVLRPKRKRAGAKEVTGALIPFQLFGPTCDNVDSMPGPFRLPVNVREGDFIEIGMMGAYSNAYRTRFNGFHADEFVVIEDDTAWCRHAHATPMAEVA